MYKIKRLSPVFMLFFAFACNNINNKVEVKKDSSNQISAAAYQQELKGKKVDLFLLTNKNKMSVYITNYGGRIVSVNVPNKSGSFTDVVLGYDSLKHYYERKENYFGALIGRYGNRIAKGKFLIDGKPFQLAINNTPNALHGGPTGFHNQVWDAKKIDNQTLELNYISKDMEEGYPGTLTVKVLYRLTDDNSIEIESSSPVSRKVPTEPMQLSSNMRFWGVKTD